MIDLLWRLLIGGEIDCLWPSAGKFSLNDQQIMMGHFLTLHIFLCMLLSVSATEKKHTPFIVKPGAGTLITQVKLNKFQCKFIYAALGGTQEEWIIKLEILDGISGVICTAERSTVSYLFFQNFKLELTGPMISVTGTDVKSSQLDNNYLKPEEYALEKNSVSSVVGKFKNHLEKVSVFSPLPHDDF